METNNNNNTATLRPFTSSDWDAFAGCESAAPEVCYWDKYAMVVDGDSLLLMILSADLDAEPVMMGNTFGTSRAARATALMVIADVSLASTFLEFV